MKLSEVKKAVSRVLKTDSIKYLGEGDFCAAYLVNHEWVFRFAKHGEARKSLRREYCLLPKISNRIRLQIPAPQIASFESQPAFSAYQLLPNKPLSKKMFLQLNETRQRHCARQAAQFLNQFHSIETEIAQRCGVQICDYQGQYSSLLADAKTYLFPMIEKADCLFIEQVIDEFLISGYLYRPTLLHGDLSPGHILFDEKTNLVTGIIDFGDMMIGDPAWDLLWIYEDYGLYFLAGLLPDFHETNYEDLLLRLFQFSMLEMIQWTVTSKIEKDVELPIALAELPKIRKEHAKRVDELLSVCKIG